MGIIEQLEILLESGSFYEIYELLKVNINRVDQNNNTVLKSINALIDNGYIEDAKELVDSLYLRKSKRIIMKIFKNKINDKRRINDYEDEVYKVYFEAREIGREYYRSGFLEEAYYTYEWGYYVTGNPVFLYYIGKILYKLGSYKLSEEYLKNYLRHCGEKTSKAYLYLGCIARIKNRISEAVTYIDISNEINNLENPNFYVDGFYDPEDENVDSVKMYNQFIAEPLNIDYFEDDLDCPEFYKIKDLYIKGNMEEAESLLRELETKKDKSLEERIAIRLLRKNNVLYKAKNRSS